MTVEAIGCPGRVWASGFKVGLCGCRCRENGESAGSHGLDGVEWTYAERHKAQ